MLVINLDETCVRCYESHSRGNVFGSAAVVQRVPKQSRKKCLTYIAIITSRREYQHLLPQYIVGNESTFLKKDVDALSSVLKGNTVLVRCAWCGGIVCNYCWAIFGNRQKSAWTDARLTASVLEHVAKALSHLAAKFRIVVVMDALRAHLARPVLDVLAKHSMLPCIVPSGMTDKMQPLDTHCFGPLKHSLRERFGAIKSDGVVPMHAFIGCLQGAINEVVNNRQWDVAFSHDGFSWQQEGLSATLTKMLKQGSHGVLHGKPSLSQVELCLGNRAQVSSAIMWRRFIDAGASSGSIALSSSAVVRKRLATSAIVDAPPLGKTRSQTRAMSAGSKLVP